MSNCAQTNIPELNPQTETCNGKYYNTFCVIHTPPLIALGFPQGNNSLANILPAISSKIFNQQEEIDSLNEQISEIQAGGDSPNYLEFSAKLEQSGIAPPEVIGTYIDEISIGSSIADPLYRGFLSSYVSTGTYRVGFEWIKLSPSAIPPGKLEITMTGGNITVVNEQAYSTASPGTTAGYRFLIEVRDSDGILSDDALGILFVAGIRFRFFTV